jgi:hypothetical protein
MQAIEIRSLLLETLDCRIALQESKIFGTLKHVETFLLSRRDAMDDLVRHSGWEKQSREKGK